MVLKFSFIACLGVILSPSLLAKANSSPPPLDPVGLGRLEGTLSYCAKIDPASESKYKEKAKLLVKRQSDQAVADARRSNEYQDSLKLTNEQLKSIPTADAENACKAYIQGK